MAVKNTIFNNKTTHKIELAGNSNLLTIDNGVMDQDTEREFNTYRYWKPFQIPMQPIINGKKSSSGEADRDSISTYGTKSLFNNYNAVYVYNKFRQDANMPLLDNPESRKFQREHTKCTIKDLVDASIAGKMGRQVYNYSDFAYCKYLGKVSNNYLITLRRFPSPCGDKIDKRDYMSEAEDEIQNHAPDIGRMVTWMGTPGNDMNSILKYTYGMQWEEQKAEIDEVEAQGDNQGTLASLFNMANPKYRQLVMQGKAGSNFAGKNLMERMLGSGSITPAYDKATWDKMYDKTKVYGPIDVIDSTKKRKRGLMFEQKFDLTFDYELRSYYGINGKAAMADLIGNILATTYTHGTFWGGERRFVGNAQDNIFANLPIYKFAEKGDFSFGGAWTALTDSISETTKGWAGANSKGSAWETIKSLAKDIGGMLLGGMLNKLGRPQKYALSSLLSDAPVGCWHLTIGNPRSPIMEFGNLVCTGASIEHYGPLGIDDFPTGLRVHVTLEHGRARDIMGIEQLYGRGDSRIYAPMGDKVLDMYKNSTTIQSSKDDTKKKYTINFMNITPVLDKEGNIISSTQDIAPSLANEEYAKRPETNTSSANLESLMRYFGMKDNKIIAMAGGEALYGAEKHKNDHVKK